MTHFYDTIRTTTPKVVTQILPRNIQSVYTNWNVPARPQFQGNRQTRTIPFK